jgi:hypothetical protein
VERLPAAQRSIAGAIPRALTGSRRSAASFAHAREERAARHELRRSAGRRLARRQREDREVLQAGENRSLAPEHLKRLVKTFDSNHSAVTFTIADIKVGETARPD